LLISASRIPFNFNAFLLRSFFFALFFYTVFSGTQLYAQIELGLSDEALLEKIQKHAFLYFAEERQPETGLVKDHAFNLVDKPSLAQSSIAATGFGLAAYAVGAEHDWIDRQTAKDWTRQTLQFFLNQAQNEHGFFYHFLDPRTGKKTKHTELSPIDTAILLAGILFAAEYYEDPEIRQLADAIYERVDWNWMLNGGKSFALSWSPSEGFSKLRWDHYDESMILYLLALGSPSHPIPADTWKGLSRPVGSYKNYRLIQMPPLFTHQYSHIWIDFKNKNDGYADYFQNSVNATLANRQFAIDQADRHAAYGANSWGLTASNGPFGYKAYGAPPGWAEHDGTVAPTGCASSIVFTPAESRACIRHLYEHLGEKLWGRYGFSDAFNLEKNWFDDRVIGIDQGPMLLMIENYRTGLVWKKMANNAYLQLGMKQAGFQEGTKEIPWPEPPQYRAPYLFGGIEIDTFLKDWPKSQALILDESHREWGQISNDKDTGAQIRFAWNEDALFFFVKARDEDLLLRKKGQNIWQDDCFELFIDPQGDGLLWKNEEDFQIGFRPDPVEDRAEVWSWFQEPREQAGYDKIVARGYADNQGFVLEGAIRWIFLGMQPKSGDVLHLSPAIHDIDKDRSAAKLQWFFRNEQDYQRFFLGRIILEGQASPIGSTHEPEKSSSAA
jgi:hypothetical protein